MSDTPARTQGDIPVSPQGKVDKKKSMPLLPKLSIANYTPDQRLVEAALGNNMEVTQSVVRRGGQPG